MAAALVKPVQLQLISTRIRKPVVVGRVISKGTAVGVIAELVGHSDLVAKIYKDPADSTDRRWPRPQHAAQFEQKVLAMLAAPPQIAESEPQSQQDLYPQIAWPTHRLLDLSGRFVGFAMRRLPLDKACDLEAVFTPGSRAREGLPKDWIFRLYVARNVAAVVEALHGVGHFVVDMKPKNMSVYKVAGAHGRVALTDADGFSIHGQSGQLTSRFHADMMSSEYASPEHLLPHGGLTKLDRAGELHDRWALAVIIFRLLNEGIHPYSGRFKGRGDQPSLDDNVLARRYAYGRAEHPEVAPFPASIHAYFEDDTRALFDRAFGTNPSERPAALAWREHLDQFVLPGQSRLRRCSRNPSHWHFSKGCGHCFRASKLNRPPAPTTAPIQRQRAVRPKSPLATGPTTQQQVATSFRPAPAPNVPASTGRAASAAASPPVAAPVNAGARRRLLKNAGIVASLLLVAGVVALGASITRGQSDGARVANSRWVAVGDGLHVHPDSIAVHGDRYRRAYVYGNTPLAKVMFGQGSARFHYEIDCRERRWRSLSIASFAGEDLRGDSFERVASEDEAGWRSAEGGEPARRKVIDLVCGGSTAGAPQTPTEQPPVGLGTEGVNVWTHDFGANELSPVPEVTPTTSGQLLASGLQQARSRAGLLVTPDMRGAVRDLRLAVVSASLEHLTDGLSALKDARQPIDQMTSDHGQDPVWAAVLTAEAKAAHEQKDRGLAISKLLEAQGLDLLNAEIATLLGGELRLSQELELAEAFHHAAIAVEPRGPDGWLQLAVTYAQRGMRAAAVDSVVAGYVLGEDQPAEFRRRVQLVQTVHAREPLTVAALAEALAVVARAPLRLAELQAQRQGDAAFNSAAAAAAIADTPARAEPRQRQSVTTVGKMAGAPEAAAFANGTRTERQAPSAISMCPNYVEVMSSIVYPRKALLDGIEGEVVVEFTVATDGSIKDAQVSSSTAEVFDASALSAVSSGLRCNAQAAEVRVRAPVSFKVR